MKNILYGLLIVVLLLVVVQSAFALPTTNRPQLQYQIECYDSGTQNLYFFVYPILSLYPEGYTRVTINVREYEIYDTYHWALLGALNQNIYVPADGVHTFIPLANAQGADPWFSWWLGDLEISGADHASIYTRQTALLCDEDTHPGGGEIIEPGPVHGNATLAECAMKGMDVGLRPDLISAAYEVVDAGGNVGLSNYADENGF